MILIIDRFEGNFAVVELENKEYVNIPKSAIPMEAKEGDIISVIIEQEETEKRRLEIKKRFSKLFDSSK